MPDPPKRKPKFYKKPIVEYLYHKYPPSIEGEVFDPANRREQESSGSAMRRTLMREEQKRLPLIEKAIKENVPPEIRLDIGSKHFLKQLKKAAPLLRRMKKRGFLGSASILTAAIKAYQETE